MSEKSEIQVGEQHFVSPWNSLDRQQAAEADRLSSNIAKLQSGIMDDVFGSHSVSPPRSSYSGRPSTGSSLRSEPYSRQDLFHTDFYQTDGKEYLKLHNKCEDGHIPKFGKNDIPFVLYENDPSSACSHNARNPYLRWDYSKSKYCCQPNPDSNETIMTRAKQVVYKMATGVTIDDKSYPYFNHAVEKYLKYYGLVHPDKLDDEAHKMLRLKQSLKTRLTRERESKSTRKERLEPLTREQANVLWDTVFQKLAEPTHNEGGRTKRNKSRKPKSRKSRKPKSRKFKRRC
jgi:hypothetical protein